MMRLTRSLLPLRSRAVGLARRAASSESLSWAKTLNAPLKETDPELFGIIEDEKVRQTQFLNLIASENFTSKSVYDSLGSVMSNKYSEGYPGERYYGGNEHIDRAERLCQQRALDAFSLDPEKWGVNVQTLSGSPANFQAYAAVLEPHDRILALDLPSGGHLSHGYQTDKKKISAISVFYETMAYQLNKEGKIDYDQMENLAKLFRPKLIVAGASAYAQLIDYARIRDVCDQHSSYMLSDMAHISGLVAAKEIPSPFDYSDIVTTTTHKSLRGPRGALIFYRKGVRSTTKSGENIMYDLHDKINFSVFPRFQGGPHNHTISAIATTLKQAQSPEFRAYQKQVMANSAKLADTLMSKGYKLVGGGTQNHLMLVDVKGSRGVDGARVERVLELVNIAVNKNTVPGDTSALMPGGIRMGAPALTSRGLDENDFEKVGEFFDRAVELTIQLKGKTGKKLKDFKSALSDPAFIEGEKDLVALRDEIKEFASTFPTIGY